LTSRTIFLLRVSSSPMSIPNSLALERILLMNLGLMYVHTPRGFLCLIMDGALTQIFVFPKTSLRLGRKRPL
jgi:hypothetical protein